MLNFERVKTIMMEKDISDRLVSIENRLHKLECQAAFVKGFKKETKSETRPWPTCVGEHWKDRQGVKWQLTEINPPYGWLNNKKTNEIKRLKLKSIRKHYILVGQTYCSFPEDED